MVLIIIYLSVQVWESLLDYDVRDSVQQSWFSKAAEIMALRVDQVQLRVWQI